MVFIIQIVKTFGKLIFFICIYKTNLSIWLNNIYFLNYKIYLLRIIKNEYFFYKKNPTKIKAINFVKEVI